jgi:hypothetical protein
MNMNRRIVVVFFSLALLLVALRCAGVSRVEGPKQAMGRGQIWSWVERDAAGNPVRLGVTLSKGVFEGPPPAVYDQVEAPLPAGTQTPPYQTAVVGWDPFGHAPAAYDVPHFDLQFYFISSEEVCAIMPGSDTIPVPARFRPPDYSVALAEPCLGTRWGDSLASELSGAPFTTTFVYGFQNGEMIFVEPMIALSYLTNEPAFRGAVKQPAAFQRQGYYPTHYTVEFNRQDSSVTVALEGLTLKKPE